MPVQPYEMRITITHLPAFSALLECARLVAETEGEERAMEWAKRVLDADIGLFCSIEQDRRPRLRLVQGGQA